MTRLHKTRTQNDAGASAVEYGLIVAAIAAAIAAIVFVFGNVVEDTFTSSCATIEAQAQTGTAC